MSNLSRLTKAELVARLEVAEARPAVTWGDVPALVQSTVSAVSREVPLFIKDCQRLAAWVRSGCMMAVEELNRPILRQPGT